MSAAAVLGNTVLSISPDVDLAMGKLICAHAATPTPIGPFTCLRCYQTVYPTEK